MAAGAANSEFCETNSPEGNFDEPGIFIERHSIDYVLILNQADSLI